MPASRLLVLAALLLALPAARCVPSFTGVKLDTPPDERILDDPSPTVPVSGRVGKQFPVSGIEVQLDGLALADALGWSRLQRRGGRGANRAGPDQHLRLPDHPGQPAAHRSRARRTAARPPPHRAPCLDHAGGRGRHPPRRAHDPRGRGLASAGPIFGPLVSSSEGELATAMLGQAAAEGCISYSNGDELRAGFVPVAEAIIMGSVP